MLGRSFFAKRKENRTGGDELWVVLAGGCCFSSARCVFVDVRVFVVWVGDVTWKFIDFLFFSLHLTYSSTPTSALLGSEMDEDEIMVSESEDSNESWTTEEFSSEFIMRYGSRSSAPNGSNEKPFACPVPGCKKRYKNVNGIKYHSKNGHKKDGKWVNISDYRFYSVCFTV